MKRTGRKLRMLWGEILVFFGYAVRAKVQLNRPRTVRCAYHPGIQMKRLFKTEIGAIYWCPLCKKRRHIESKGNKLVPA